MSGIVKLGAALLLTVCAASKVFSAEEMTSESINRVVTEVSEVLKNQYIFPEVGEEMARNLLSRLESGEYQGIVNVDEFSDLLTNQMREISNDQHLFIFHSDLPMRTDDELDNPTPEDQAADLAVHRYLNFGIRSVARLDGNIGYFDFASFMDAGPSSQALGTAMDILQNTSGLIVDLRQNFGGSPETVALLASYFLGPDSVHVDSIYWKNTDTTQEFWTSTDLDGAWYGTQRPVLILASTETFSAAEAFSYAMQAFGRAEVIGETTRGGAHPGGIQRVADNFHLWVSNGRAINAVTGTNWEGTGVSPDYPVEADSALLTAHKHMLKVLIDQTEDDLARQDREMHLQLLEAQ